MDEVRGLLDMALAHCLSGVAGCAVVTGDAEGERPDQYVSVVSQEAEARGVGVYLVDVEVRVVVPVDDPAVVLTASQRLRNICDYLDSANCPFRAYNDQGIRVFGYRLTSMDNKVGTRSRADIITMKVGAKAT